jgi:predicted transcriptional regulator of viral defense system
MKPRTFTWAWQDYAPQPDPLMTPERALRLLSAWRSTSRQITSQGSRLRRLERLGRGRYRVTEPRYGESATIAWEAAQ